jgi:hypothetical protein
MKKFKSEFKVVQHVAMETSMGLVTERVKRTMDYTVCVDGTHGWFEMYDEETGGRDFYAEGQLIFEGNTLVDYDGIFELPEDILDKLDEAGYDVNDMR